MPNKKGLARGFCPRTTIAARAIAFGAGNGSSLWGRKCGRSPCRCRPIRQKTEEGGWAGWWKAAVTGEPYVLCVGVLLYWTGWHLYRTPKGAAGVVGHTYLKIPVV